MTALRTVAAVVSFALALAAAGLGLLLTAGLIDEYGSKVSPLRLAGQAAIVWVPAAMVLLAIGVACLSRRRRS